MEDNKPSGSSDRDRQMMGNFEPYVEADTDDEEDEKKSAAVERSDDDKKSEKAEKAEAEEVEPDDKEAIEEGKLDEVSETETAQIIEQYAEARSEDLKEDLDKAEPDSIEEAVALANAALIEAIQEHEASGEEDLDAALEETIEALGLGDMVEASEVEEPEEDEPVTATNASTRVVSNTTPPPVPPVTPPQTPMGPAAPAPPLRPFIPTPTPNTLNKLSEADEQALRTERFRANRHRAGQLLLMGGVGYLIGRRRGRLNTEAKLLPVQAKLEQEVQGLHDKVAEREDKIRKLAAEKVLQQPETARPQLIERVQTRFERRQAATEQATRAETTRRLETFGKLAIPAAEALPRAETREKSVETLTVPELLLIAQRIEKDGVSVKEMYENGRLDAVGLRRVVKEYLSGEHLDRVLGDNLRQLESFEGQPLSQQAQKDQAGAGQTNVTQTTAVPVPASQYVPNMPPTPQSPVSRPKPQAPSPLEDKPTIIAMGVVAAIIIALIIILFS